MFKNFHNSLNSLEYQYSVHNSLLHLHCNFKMQLHHRTWLKIDNKRTFRRTSLSLNSTCTLTHFILAMNVRNNYDLEHNFTNQMSHHDMKLHD